MPNTSGKRICPHCLRFDSGANQCSACQNELPALWAQGGADLRLLPMPTLGWPGHGRSTYLTALAYLLTRLNLVFKNCSYRELDEPTRKFLIAAKELCLTGKLPDHPTPVAKQPRLLLLLKSLETWGDFVLAMEDSAGKHFSGASVLQDQATFLCRSPGALLMLSPRDLERGDDWRLVDMLLNTYLDAIEQNGLDPAQPRRGVVIVLSKADLLFEQLPKRLQDYLKSDPLAPILRPRKFLLAERDADSFIFGEQKRMQYLAEMQDIDRELREWLGKDPHFRSLQLKAEQHQLEIRYSLVSATGETTSPASRELSVLWRPCRVLDPFFWMLQLDRQLGGSAAFLEKLEPAKNPPPEFSLEVTNTRTAARTRADLRNDAGSLEPLSIELAGLSFAVEGRGVTFKTPLPRTLAVLSGGVWNDQKGERFALGPGDGLRLGDWEIRLCAGFFHPEK